MRSTVSFVLLLLAYAVLYGFLLAHAPGTPF